MSEQLLAAVDCGTNSVRLLVCRLTGGRLVEVDRRLHITRLGQGVDATGRFHPEALARTLAAMADFGAELDSLGVARRRVVATSAARDAANSGEFFAGVRDRIGVEAEIIPGEEEARLSYAGAVTALPDLAQPVLVMDIGGGSTELVSGRDGRVDRAVSLDIGSVRVRERFLPGDPPEAAQVEAARSHIDALLDGSGIEFAAVASWVGVGGTVTSLSALVQGLAVYDRSLVHGSVVDLAALDRLTGRLLGMPVAAVAALPTMVPGRADVLCAGALICARVGARLGGPLTVSEADILDGIVSELAGR
ncbi:MAG: Ppx/GppA family phosphatase [Propionibacteriaceae bacterium]|nr:Ppx/GppA family phosphatase [Propionibacteriaceae bacterium]